LLLALDFDLGACRAEPALPLVDEALAWVKAAFAHAGACPTIGTKPAPLLTEAGLADVQGFGVQGYAVPGDSGGPALLIGVVRTLAPQIVTASLVTRQQIGNDTLEACVADAVRVAGSVILAADAGGRRGRRRRGADS